MARDTRINIHEGIQWKDTDGREFQSWEVYEAVRTERDRYRKALERIEDTLMMLTPIDVRQIVSDALEGSGE